jgi:hypothetical protein
MQSNKMTRKQILARSSTLFLALLFPACSPSEAPSNAAPESSFANERFLNERPTDAIRVSEARAKAEPGDEVAISGLIGGTLKPFVDGYAAFVLADPSILFCNEMPDEHCETPWDACCEDPDKLNANRISVQFVDANKQVLSENLKGKGGLRELSQVVVTGTISPDSTPENVNLLAQSLYLIEE